MKQSIYGPCGLFCGACGVEDCDGCQSDNIDEYVSNCKFRRCTREKNIDFCCFCDTYACKELSDFMNDEWPHHWTIKPNLAYIMKNGLDDWLNFQRKEWSCDQCGAEIKWYQKTCGCGVQLKAWDVPDCIDSN